MGVDYTKEELLEMFPGTRTVPQIWLESKNGRIHIGGYTDLVKFLKDQGNLVQELNDGKTVNVKFNKKDGTVREMLCTKNWDVISEFYTADKKTDRVYTEPEGVVQVFDLENKGWRSFRLDSVISHTVVEA
jgi:hypothetical protein